MMTFGAYIRKLRLARNIPQTALAHAIKISPSMLSDVETGRKHAFGMDKCRRLVKALDLTRDEAYKLYDLSGRTNRTPPPDITLYLIQNPEANTILRMAREVGFKGWDRIAKAIQYDMTQAAQADKPYADPQTGGDIA